MSLQPLIDLIHSRSTENWEQRNRDAFFALLGKRYRKDIDKVLAIRAPQADGMDVPFAAYIHKSNPSSGPYSGLSFVVFPAPTQPCLFGLVVGTNGLGEDHAILGRPGHARKTRAICDWLNAKWGKGALVAWGKHDPTRTDLNSAGFLSQDWPGYEPVFNKYSNVMYAMVKPTEDLDFTKEALAALLDLFMEERQSPVLSSERPGSDHLRAEWLAHVFPEYDDVEIFEKLTSRRFLILQGPPGTGKTRMAGKLLENRFGKRGMSIQFHANTSYENFIGGLSPEIDRNDLGLRFQAKPGFLLSAAAAARQQPEKPFLLHIDEINRADLGKVLGEAIYLLEERSDIPRELMLPYDFPGTKDRFALPSNLYIIGTMNSADRSIALVDIAVRRRFGFVQMWPSIRVVNDIACSTSRSAFQRLLSLFLEYASEEVLQLMPGHSYFLQAEDSKATESLLLNLVPLLEEYISQGYVGGFEEQLRSYIQWVRAGGRVS
ncbi:MAG: AAA family ATPase [Bryobacterales bacterium]|jgi:5-methylcytosine-specific restriction protein B|nr:AAA family ATPase [Bryobacterales bacterium]